jgi:hypothetical protein
VIVSQILGENFEKEMRERNSREKKLVIDWIFSELSKSFW